MTVRALLIHDQSLVAKSFAENISWKNNIPTQGIESFSEAMEFIRQGKLSKIDCVIIHKDLGQYSLEGDGLVDKLAQTIHEVNETVRIGIVSGEYPNGGKHVLELKADFYLPSSGMRLERDWLVEQLEKGPALPAEIELRGKEVITPHRISRSPERE